MTSMTDGCGQQDNLPHDSKGQRTLMTDAKGRATNYLYDQRRRPTKTTVERPATENQTPYSAIACAAPIQG